MSRARKSGQQNLLVLQTLTEGWTATKRASIMGFLLFALVASPCLSAQVLVSDRGVQTAIAGPGAPAHIIGLQRLSHVITIDTGVRVYGLQYTVAHDDKRPDIAIPGEGYIGMTQPSGQNWYAGGFFDLQINGQSIGTTRIHSLTGRSSGERGYVDFVFDTMLAVVRIRFVTLAGSDVLFCQTLLEPKTEITSLRVVLRCYPSAFVTEGERHVLTPVRDIPQGDKADLDIEKEWWLFYYDRVFDSGYISHDGRSGVGGCSVLWLSNQVEKVSFAVGSYGTDTLMTFKPHLRDLRFIFCDHCGEKNEAAMASLRARAESLQQQLSSFTFADPTVARWSLAEKLAEVERALASLPQEKEAAAHYAQWSKELDAALQAMRSGAGGAIMAEATAASLISDWERSLPELKLRALLNEI